MHNAQHCCGNVAIVGRPNAGKSTLLNRLIGQKISITSRKPQTTRFPILGIATTPQAQYIFVDTPGFQTQRGGALNRAMQRGIAGTLANVDAIVWVIDSAHFDRRDAALLKLIPNDRPVVVALNKIDLLRDKALLLPLMARLAEQREFAALVPLSAKRAEGLAELLAALRAHLPLGPALYAEDEVTDRSERFLAAELIREKLIGYVGDEIPHSAHVTTREFVVEQGLRRIAADIIVAKASHKAIVIGDQGERLKAIASAARAEMEQLFGGKVFLQVWVRVKEAWTSDPALLKSFGYE
jgi:GTPase